MPSPSMQPQPSPGKHPKPATMSRSTGRSGVGTSASVNASLNFSDAVNVVIDIGALDATANNVSVSWDGTVVFTTTNPSDPGLQSIRTPYTNGTTNNSLSVTLSFPVTTPPTNPVTYSARSIAANQSSTPTPVTLRS